ncbi:MAG: peptidoglycan endopeptidase [Nitrospiraceae bacterium]|nr:MAG: peptidoglycan endopeptidase [Nitrospiraceae bacterium]
MKISGLPLSKLSKFFLLILLFVSFASGSEASGKYTVKKGDSFYTISKKYHININDLKNANSASATGLKPGDKIVIPSKKNASHKENIAIDSSKDSVSNKKTSHEKSPADKTAEPLKTAQKDLYYIVKKGDTLSSISRSHAVSVADLTELNNLKKSVKLKRGQKLLLKFEGQRSYTVRRGDTIWNIAKKFKIDAEELMEINDMDSPSLKSGQKLYLEEIQPDLAELQNKEILIKNLEVEMQKASESEEFSERSFPDKLTLFAKKLLNIPYKFGGNSFLGIDCSAYVKKVYGLLGIDLPRTAREQYNEGEAIDKEELSVGDLVFFRTYASFPSHVGIYLGNNLFIHASSKGKKVKVDNLDAPYFVKRFIGAKRLLTDGNKSVDPQS